jgi:hypothetical protein
MAMPGPQIGGISLLLHTLINVISYLSSRLFKVKGKY